MAEIKVGYINVIDFLKELNAEQLQVVQNGDGPCLVLAGAGSGKTRTITYRVAYLLEKGIDPKNILLVTFTNKAAQEMKDRVSMLIETQYIASLSASLPWSGTYHHIAYRMLRQYAKLLGYENNFTILDSEDSLDVMKLCIKEEGIDRKQKRFPSPAVIHSIISFARNAETTIEDVLDRKHPHWLELSETIIHIAEDYHKRKVQTNAMDFDDLLVNLYLLLFKFSQVKEKFAEQFQYVLVDEYQDTNKIQASIIKLCASKHNNVLVVGDDAQSIYSFRAADIGHILDFERDYPDAKIFRLETNYRSTPNILNLANDIIAQNRSQYKKELRSIVEPLVMPEVYSFSDASEEGEFVAERILELQGEGIALNKIAVLFRAAFHSQALEMELVKRDIPYDYRGGTRFFERAHIKDVLAYLRIYANKSDAIAWSRVLNMQVGIGPAGVQRITEALQHSSTSAQFGTEEMQHLGSELSGRGQVGWNDFLQIWRKLTGTQGTPGELITALLDSKYIDYLESEYPDYRERMDDIKQLAAFAERQKDLSQFLAESSMQESYARTHVKNDSDEGGKERLVLSTIHQAKGLEWDAVFIINLSAGQFPNDRAMREENGIEEERRLFYVAVTRARKFLYMSYPLMGWSASMLQGPSIFIEELDRDLIDEHTYENSEGSIFNDPSDGVDDITYEALDDDKPKRSFLKSLDEL